MYGKRRRWVLRSAGHSDMQLRSRITKSTHFKMFKKINGELGLRELCICNLQVKQTPFTYLRLALFTSHPCINYICSLPQYTRGLLYTRHWRFLWSIFKTLRQENRINESNYCYSCSAVPEQLFGSFKLFLRFINRCQPTQRTDCELLKKEKKSFFNIFKKKK